MTEAYLGLIAEPLRYLHTAFGARVRLIGGSAEFSLAGVAIDRVPWQESTETAELAACHVGVMPLVDGPWERGKCGYKLVQYMAAARPSVASAVGQAMSIVVNGKTGFRASSTEEWISALSRFAADRELVRTMGLAARQRAETAYSVQVTAPRLIELFTETALSAKPVSPSLKRAVPGIRPF
jgi:glycosyltransferase involved in cell wall biosynthesis